MNPQVVPQEYEMVPVEALNFHPRNPNQGDFGAIHTSVEANGFWGALVVQRSTSRVLVGNHRLAAARALAIDALPVLWIDVDDEQALRVLLADNRTARLGHDNSEVLTQLLMELTSSDSGLDGTGYEEDDLDALLNALHGDTLNPPAPTPKPKALTVTVLCDSKPHQAEVMATLAELGLRVKAT